MADLTINELKNEKETLRQEMLLLLQSFNRKTGIAVKNLDIRNSFREDGSVHFTVLQIELENI